jgi:hypothetical protein
MRAIPDAPDAIPATRRIAIDLLSLDLGACDRCRAADARLAVALVRASALLRAEGFAVEARKVRVASEAQVRALRFVSSPTVRVNGRDIAPEVREDAFAACGAVSGQGAIGCREWVFDGVPYADATVALLVDAILRTALDGAPPAETTPPAEVPETPARFTAGKSASAAVAAGACCVPEERPACCGAAPVAASCCLDAPGDCGCA